jgi:gas vesicle protein
MIDDERDDSSSPLSSFILGLGVGLSLGLLFTPRSGEKNRKLIAAKAREGAQRANEVLEEAREQVEAGIANAGDAAQELKDRVGESVTSLKDRVQDALRAGQEAYREEMKELEAEQEHHRPSSSRAATSGS